MAVDNDRVQQQAPLVCFGGQSWSEYEQNTQQSPARGRSNAEQDGQV
jgi:hypothetical protein